MTARRLHRPIVYSDLEHRKHLDALRAEAKRQASSVSHIIRVLVRDWYNQRVDALRAAQQAQS